MSDESGGAQNESGDASAPLPARIDGIRVAGTPQGPVPVVLLTADTDPPSPDGPDAGGPAGDGELADDVVPIFIGFDEATSIARGQDATDIGRPLTHDLLLDAIEELGGRVTRVVVSAIEDGTYIAELHVQTPRDEVTIDARPSDALALASRTGAPIRIARGVYDDGREDSERFVDLDDIREVAELA